MNLKGSDKTFHSILDTDFKNHSIYVPFFTRRAVFFER